MKSILVPTDFSSHATEALKLALEISGKNKAKVHVLHVVEYPVGGSVDPVGLMIPTPYDKEFIDALVEKGKERMESFCKTHLDECSTRIELGNAYLIITQFIKDHDIDLVIMGTKGASGLKEILLGSNAERVVRSSQCPVITINKQLKLSEISDIAFAIDVNEVPSRELVGKLQDIQDLTNAKIHIVHINTPNTFERDQLVKHVLDDTIDSMGLKNAETHIYNDTNEQRGIMSFANQINAGLIAMVTHGRKGLAHLLAGSLTEDVVNHSKKAVWTCRLN